jgi:predicted N-acetyltransferase YhbS
MNWLLSKRLAHSNEVPCELAIYHFFLRRTYMSEFEYTKGTPSDFDEIVDLANYVFSHDHSKHDFPTLLPMQYGKGANTAQNHYLAKSNGKIVALLGSFPIETTIMGEPFKVFRIGTVSVHPYYRGQGHMKVLLNTAIADMKTAGASFGVLGGYRQRYEYFGFEPCGIELDFTVTATNLNHAFQGRKTDDITFLRMEKADTENFAQAQRLHQKQPLCCERRAEEFFDICRSWYSKSFFILKNGIFLGYAICSSDYSSIIEIELCDTSMLSDVIISYMTQFCVNAIEIGLASYEKEKIAILETYCENISINISKSFNIFDYEKTIRQLLKLKATYSSLCDGQIVLEIEGFCRLCIRVDCQQVTVSKTIEPAELFLSHLKAMNFLFSPVSAFYSYSPELFARIASWFPLPLYWPSSDRI